MKKIILFVGLLFSGLGFALNGQTQDDLPKIGELVQCQHCASVFEVVWLFPLDFIPADVQGAPTAEHLHDEI